jgi:S1-C subfamily serine protease
MICGKLDAQLYKIARENQCLYTRYCDDITFSTKQNSFRGIATIHDDEFALVQLSDKLEDIIEDNGFYVNKDKVHFASKKSRQSITGIVVNEKMNVRRTYVRNLRSAIYKMEKDIDAAESEYIAKYKKSMNYASSSSIFDHISGKLSYLKMIKGDKDKTYKLLKHRFDLLLGKQSFFFSTQREQLTAAIWAIEDKNTIETGTGFMLKGVGIITCAHVIRDNPCAILDTRPGAPLRKIDMEIIKRDEALDIAILRPLGVDIRKYYALEKSDAEFHNTPEQLILAGYPGYRLGHTLSIKETYCISHRVEHAIQLIELSDQIHKGNSGGPVLDSELKVVGIAAKGGEPGQQDLAIHIGMLSSLVIRG